MKSCLLVTAVGIILIFSACNKHSLKIAPDVPACIQDEIRNNYKNPNWMIGAVEEYQFQSKAVYAFQPDQKRIADASTAVKDANCNTLCHVGGFGGPSVNLCNGENFFQAAVLKRVIWELK